MGKLTDKQQLFVREYLVDLNATQAAIRAGYAKKTAYAIGAENLRKPQIQKEIEDAAQKRSEQTGITAERVLNAIADIAFDDKEETRNNDRLKALELLGKHLVLFTERLQADLNLYGKIQREIVKPKHQE